MMKMVFQILKQLQFKLNKKVNKKMSKPMTNFLISRTQTTKKSIQMRTLFLTSKMHKKNLKKTLMNFKTPPQHKFRQFNYSPRIINLKSENKRGENSY